jgi:hypothetical protein
MKRTILILAGAASLAFGQAKPIAQLVKQDGKFTFLVDGTPFIILGGQVNNESAFSDRLELAWPKFKAMNMNTVEYPVYWNEIEREEGKFDFTDFDRLLFRSRAEGLRVVLLWFGAYKNGAMDWAPNWVKSDPVRFPRVLDVRGKPIRVLSPHSRATLEADKRAYLAMITHLRQLDEADRTVVMMQVENESGLLGSVRDYSPESSKLFNGPAPAALVSALKKKPGTWKEVFGSFLAEESFTAYYLSSYINEIAKAGKQVYPLVTYVNTWNGGADTSDQYDLFDRPGESYPSGGPVSHMLDLWKANAPDIDILSSDTSKQPTALFLMINRRYARPDNPYWSPEAGQTLTGARGFFSALAELGAIGYGAFGVNGATPEQFETRFAELAADYRMVKNTMPALIALRAAGKLKSAVEEDVVRGQSLNFDRYQILVRFLRSTTPSSRVLVGELGPDEFLIMGFRAAVDIRPAVGSDFTAAQFLQVEEGLYENGVWKTTNRGRIYQGSDAANVSLPAQGAIFRVKLLSY